MKRNSGFPTYVRTKAVKVIELFLAASFSLALFSCSSSSTPPATPAAKVNQHLAYQHLLDKDATLKPHQTAVLNLSSLVDNHLSNSPGSGYHNLPYEITNAGTYKFCIPDSDTHLTQVELFDPAGGLMGNWKKGEPCTSVPLLPGKYSMHVHLDTTESDPPIFLKPHDVKVKQVGTMKATRKTTASYIGPIPSNQFLYLNVASLTDILKANKNKGIKERWGVMTSSASGKAYGELLKPQYRNVWFDLGGYSDIIYKVLNSAPLNQTSQLKITDLLSVNLEQNDLVSLLQADTPVVLDSGYCLKWHQEQRQVCSDDCIGNGSYVTVNVCDTTGKVIGLAPSGDSVGDYFSLSPTATHFKLLDALKSPVNWYDTEWVTGAGASPVDFNIKVRYGITSGLTYPAMLANEVALFDDSFGSSGFPVNTHYWIINADMMDFNDFAFDNPTNRIKTVIAGRGARARLFENPSFQGDSVYVSPPVDGEMLMTGSDNQLLENGAIGSIRIEPNTNDISVYEYEYHVIVSANTCIGCDLRGFDLSSIISKNIKNKPPNYGFNFTDSDLSNSRFSVAGGIYFSNFTRTNFNSANLANDYFDGCNFTGTDFTNAVLQNVKFSAHSNQTIDANNYIITSVSNSFYNSCPKFESADLRTVSNFDWVFYIGSPNLSGNAYNVANWWNNGQPLCRTSLSNSKVTANLFTDKQLWQFVDAPGVDFSNMNLDGAVFAGVNLTGAKFTNASLKGTVFVKANLTNVDLTGADLTGAHLEGATLTGVGLHKAKTLSKAYLSGITLNAPTNLAGLDMSGAILKGGSYKNWDGYDFGNFHPASIIGAYMFNTMLNGADLSGALLSNVSWYGDKATGENAVMNGTHFETADLPGLKLMQAHLQNANFTNAVLVNADFSTTTLDHSFNGTSFYMANLKGANLSGANLTGATLTGAFISTSSGQTTLEVLDDPATYPNQYKFFYQNYLATTPPASTNGVISCPDGNPPPPGGCGAITSQYWVSKARPQDPAGCAPDGQGGLTCQSQRHPKQ